LRFPVCLLVGGLDADNPFATTVWRALVAMMASRWLSDWCLGHGQNDPRKI
jgi:hypothetical protein